MQRVFLAGASVIAVVLSLSAAPAIARPGHGGKMFDAADTNGDGVISREEHEANRAERFTKSDGNGDGAVSLEEFRQARESRREERMSAMFERRDSDGDGIITMEEFEADADARFERMDADGDGAVSRDEARDAMRATRSERRAAD